MTRFFKVTHKAGAFIDGVWYPPETESQNPMDSVVPLDLPEGAKKPLWGVEVDEQGNELDERAEGDFVQDNLTNSLANKIAGNGTNAPAAPVSTGKEAEQRKQVILDTLELLDHDNDAHWTADGLPKVDIVSETAGIETSRAEITEAKPDFKRAKAA